MLEGSLDRNDHQVHILIVIEGMHVPEMAETADDAVKGVILGGVEDHLTVEFSQVNLGAAKFGYIRGPVADVVRHHG
jgi:hypothetical protein